MPSSIPLSAVPLSTSDNRYLPPASLLLQMAATADTASLTSALAHGFGCLISGCCALRLLASDSRLPVPGSRLAACGIQSLAHGSGLIDRFYHFSAHGSRHMISLPSALSSSSRLLDLDSRSEDTGIQSTHKLQLTDLGSWLPTPST